MFEMRLLLWFHRSNEYSFLLSGTTIFGFTIRFEIGSHISLLSYNIITRMRFVLTGKSAHLCVQQTQNKSEREKEKEHQLAGKQSKCWFEKDDKILWRVEISSAKLMLFAMLLLFDAWPSNRWRRETSI